MSAASPGLRVGVDIGGTFTDLVFLTPNGQLEKLKVPSTPDDYAEAIVAGGDDRRALASDGRAPGTWSGSRNLFLRKNGAKRAWQGVLSERAGKNTKTTAPLASSTLFASHAREGHPRRRSRDRLNSAQDAGHAKPHHGDE